MGKPIDLHSLNHIDEADDEELRKSFLKLSDNGKNKKNLFSYGEFKDFISFSQRLMGFVSGNKARGYFINCEVGLGISQQFDILRFSEKKVVNIELKHERPKKGFPAICKQLQKHRFLLNNLKRKVVACTFVCEENKLWLLKDEQLEEITFNYLSSLIDDDYSYENVLDKTELSDLVISPYSEPRRFNHHCYYLSDEQVRVKEVILRNDKKKFGIIGGPGTGKSMLLFDIGKKYKGEDKKVLIIFCAQLEESEQLSDEFDMKIISIRDISINYNIRQSAAEFLNSFDVILVDEAQRLLESQYNTLMSLVDKKIIFSTDHQQTLHESEKDSNIEYKLCHNSQVKELALKNKIRTDIEMSSFIQKFLDLKSNVEPYDYKNVHIVYFKDSKSACEYIENMERNNVFTPIELTEYIDKFATRKKRQKIYPNSISCHEVIGKEYNNVLVPLDSYFSYSNDHKLFSLYTNYCGYYPYFEDSEIFEALTRVKKKLLLVIIDNVKLYRVLQSILTWKEDILTASPNNYVYEKNYSTWEKAYDHLEIEKDNKEMYASKMELNGKNGQVKISYYPKNL